MLNETSGLQKKTFSNLNPQNKTRYRIDMREPTQNANAIENVHIVNIRYMFWFFSFPMFTAAFTRNQSIVMSAHSFGAAAQWRENEIEREFKSKWFQCTSISALWLQIIVHIGMHIDLLAKFQAIILMFFHDVYWFWFDHVALSFVRL